MAIVDELVAILGYELRGEQNLTRWKAGLKSAETQLSALAAAASRYGKIIGTAVGAGAVLLGKNVIATGKQFEAYNIQLETLLGSQAEAEKALAWIATFAKTTPLEVADVVEAFVSLKNSGIDPTNGSLQALTDAMAGSGKGTQLLGRLTLALGQAWTKQKLQGGEILQLVEAGIPVWDMLADATGRSVQELQGLSEKGKLGRKEIQLLIDAIGTKYAGASEKFSRSLEGISSNLSDNWTQFLRQIADSGFFDFVKQRMQSLLETVNRLAADGTLDRWAKTISDTFIIIATSIETIVTRITTHGAFLLEFLASLDPTTVYALGAAFGLLAIRLFPLLWVFTALALAMDDFFSYLEGGESKFGDFVAWIQELTGASEGLAQALAGIVASMGLLIAMKPFGVLKGIGRFLGGMASGAAGEAAGGLAGRKGGLLGGLMSKGAMLAGIAASSMLWAQSDSAMFPSEIKKRDEQQKRLDEYFDQKRSSAKITGDAAAANAPEAGRMEGSSIATMLAGMDNFNANLAKMTAGAAAGATVTDASQDNRSYPVTVNSSIVQNISEAAAPGAAGSATASAVGKAAVGASSRIVPGPQL